jgi:hypothetical protein
MLQPVSDIETLYGVLSKLAGVIWRPVKELNNSVMRNVTNNYNHFDMDNFLVQTN